MSRPATHPTSRLSADTSSFLARGSRAKRTCESLLAPDGPRVITSGRSTSRLSSDTHADVHFGLAPVFALIPRPKSEVQTSSLSIESPPEAHFLTAPSRSTKSSQGEIMNLATRTLCCFVILFYFFTFRVGDKKKETQSRAAI